MEKEGYRKLDMDLPRAPVVNQRPFIMGGWLLLLLLVIIALVVYQQQKNGAKKKIDPLSTQPSYSH